MRTQKSKYNLSIQYILSVFLIYITSSLIFPFSYCQAASDEADKIDYSKFQLALDAQKEADALTEGELILKQLSEKYQADRGYRAFKSKYDAAIFLADQMQQQLKKATASRMTLVANELFQSNNAQQQQALSIAPAKSFYDTSNRIFTMPVDIGNLDNEEKTFLAGYYNLKLRSLTSSIAKAGQALSIAEPSFQNTHDYVLVLPLLHASEVSSVNIGILPSWMQKSDQLDIFVTSSLLHFGFPFYAMNIAKQAAQLRGDDFSELEFYKSSAQRCGIEHATTAGECLERAVTYAKEWEPDSVINIKIDTVQLWLDSENYTLAASEAHNIYQEFPEHQKAGQAIWLYYYALSRSNNITEILSGIDTAINDERCAIYKPKLMYIKWWSLRRERDKAAQIAALEYELLKAYGDDPMVAPILLSRATDLLAAQDYTNAHDLLSQLVEKFPATASATQAEKMLVKLTNINSSR